MNNQLKQVIKEIANIQLTALRKLKEDPTVIDYEDLMMLFPESDLYISESLNERISLWETIKANPLWINTIDQYTLGVSTHILFTMESEWVLQYPEGVNLAWEFFDKIYKKYHPELKSIWTLNNLSNISTN